MAFFVGNGAFQKGPRVDQTFLFLASLGGCGLGNAMAPRLAAQGPLAILGGGLAQNLKHGARLLGRETMPKFTSGLPFFLGCAVNDRPQNGICTHPTRALQRETMPKFTSGLPFFGGCAHGLPSLEGSA